jgi:isoamylase
LARHKAQLPWLGRRPSQGTRFTLAGFDDDPDIHVMMNMHWAALDMDIPTISGRQWARVVDTSLPSPSDIAEPGMEVACPGQSYRVNGRSIVVLLNKPA